MWIIVGLWTCKLVQRPERKSSRPLGALQPVSSILGVWGWVGGRYLQNKCQALTLGKQYSQPHPGQGNKECDADRARPQQSLSTFQRCYLSA